MLYAITLTFAFIFGAILGSFAKCLADRSLTHTSFLGRSVCDHCHKNLKFIELLPVISYLAQKGRCRSCKKKLSKEYLLTEILSGALVALLAYLTIPPFFYLLGSLQLTFLFTDFLFKALVLVVFTSTMLTDIHDTIIPDRITLPAIAIAVLYLTVTSIAKIFILFFQLKADIVGQYLLPPQSDFFIRRSLVLADPLISGLEAAFGLGLFFFLIIVLTKGKGMGGGDLKLAIFIGLVLGVANSIVALLLAFITGSIVGLGLIFLGKKRFNQTIPFGPFLSVGAITALLFGHSIVNLYLSLS